MRIILNKKHLRLGLACIVLGAALLVVAQYYTGDQQNSVEWSANFTIDTRDSTATSQPFTTVSQAYSGLFSIDTRDSDTISKPISVTIQTSGFFTIDTRDADNDARALTLTSSSLSGFFTIDTRDDGKGYEVSHYFTIDTRDPDAITQQYRAIVSGFSGLFVIDTLDPAPLDANADGLHDTWVFLYFGSDPGIIDPLADLQSDGYSIFAEFAFGLDPHDSNNSPLREQWIADDGGQKWFYIRYSRHILAVNMVDYQIEVSDDLINWQDKTNIVEFIEPIQNEGGSVEIVTARYPLPTPQTNPIFLRIRAVNSN